MQARIADIDTVVYLAGREELRQSVPLPEAWSRELERRHGPGKVFYSDYGLIHYDGAAKPPYQIAFFDSEARKLRFAAKLGPPRHMTSGSCPANYGSLPAPGP